MFRDREWFQTITGAEALERAWGPKLDQAALTLKRGRNVLIESEKLMVNAIYQALRRRVRAWGHPKFKLLSGLLKEEEGFQNSLMMGLIRQLREGIFSGQGDLCLVMPHLDVAVTTSQSTLSDRAREVMAMIYENPEITLLAFKDPQFEIPLVIEQAFPVHIRLIGLPREQLPALISEQERIHLGGPEFNPYRLYPYVSGLNPLRFREVIDLVMEMPRMGKGAQAPLREIRALTLSGGAEIPQVDLWKDIGGYRSIKQKIQREILDLWQLRDSRDHLKDMKEVELLIPRGLLFVGPPGTGKTYFAKAMASALNAMVILVSGPELKSKWVGESEAHLRQIFERARRGAPAVIVFDEIDSFATQRGFYTGSGVEHSMVNQLLTEMDGFRREELILVVGTTNFIESLDPALLRPGRFELQISVPYPSAQDRREILELYAKRLNLDLSPEILEALTQWTEAYVDPRGSIKFSGDHLYALMRAIKRMALRGERIQGVEGYFSLLREHFPYYREV